MKSTKYYEDVLSGTHSEMNLIECAIEILLDIRSKLYNAYTLAPTEDNHSHQYLSDRDKCKRCKCSMFDEEVECDAHEPYAEEGEKKEKELRLKNNMTKTIEEIFTQNFLDGDKIQDGQALSSSECFEAIKLCITTELQSIIEEVKGIENRHKSWKEIKETEEYATGGQETCEDIIKLIQKRLSSIKE